MDIRPPKQWRPTQAVPPAPPKPLTRPAAPTPVTADKPSASPFADLDVDQPAVTPTPVWPKKRHWPWVLGVVAGLLVVVAGGVFWWYQDQLRPVDANNPAKVRFEVKDGANFSDVTTALYQRGLIKNTFMFDLYARLQGKRGALKASTCSLTKAEPAAEILDKLNAGCHDFKSVTFYPGATIEKPLYKPPDSTLDQTMYVKYVLKRAGYSDEVITAALTKQYQSTIFADKPAGTSLEGYIFGETYYVASDATAEEVLQETFKQFETIIKKDDLVAKFKAQGLNLYQGITLASIVQRELNCEDKPTPERKSRCYGYQQSIAQIFLKRLREGTTLGSDVTFIYAADMMGVAPTIDLDSPYNTRKNPGLPPGPIGAPGELALMAVANPSATDYLFFIAGDDGLIYFAHTNAEHQANIRNYCQKLCSQL